MTRNLIICLFIACLFCLAACNLKKTKSGNNFKNPEVSWELMATDVAGEEAYYGLFTLRNSSKTETLSSNWRIYFSQAPRTLIQDSIKSSGHVIHINGDYYCIIPDTSFSLAPGENSQFIYRLESPIVRYYDAPRGLFIVFSDLKGETIRTENIASYSILPMPQHMQKRLQHTPLWQYEQNQNIVELPKEEWQKIIPGPNELLATKDTLVFSDKWICRFDESLNNEGVYLLESLKKMTGLEIKSSKQNVGQLPQMELQLVKSGIFSPEAYKLTLAPNSISIIASDKAGIFYGVQSFLSLVYPSSRNMKNGNIILQGFEINDKPRFSYRGLHVDVCRNFQEKEEIMKIIDLMSMYKINTLHLILTEDEGWRIEIKKLPELTEISSKRGYTPDESDMLNPAYGSGAFPERGKSYGTGYYTQEEFIEILRYAANRHVKIIPGINLPGHARAAIKAMEARYKKLLASGDSSAANEFRLITDDDTSRYLTAQYYNDNIVDVSRESVYSFVQLVVDEVTEMYSKANVTLDFIHTGGDEVPDGAWTGSPGCRKLAQEKGIANMRNMQLYFFEKLIGILEPKNLTIGGWEEIVLSRSTDGSQIVNTSFTKNKVVPYVWNNMWGAEDLGNRMANSGYPIVLCCASNLYFDMAYTDDPFEPGLNWAGYVNEKDPWDFQPFNLQGSNKTEKQAYEKLLEKKRNRIAGLQAQLWAETIEGPETLEYLLLPKLFSLAERSWAKQPVWENPHAENILADTKQAEWNRFLNSLTQKELMRISQLYPGINYRIAPPGIKNNDGMITVNSSFPGSVTIYSFDSSQDFSEWKTYSQPLKTEKTVYFLSMDKTGKKSRIVSTQDK